MARGVPGTKCVPDTKCTPWLGWHKDPAQLWCRVRWGRHDREIRGRGMVPGKACRGNAAVRVCSGSNGAREARHRGRRDGVDAMDVFAKTPGLWGVAQRSCSIWDFRVWAFLKDPRKVLSLASHAARTTHAKPTKPRNRETSRASIKGPRRAPGFLHRVPRAPPTQNPTKQRNSETDRGG